MGKILAIFIDSIKIYQKFKFMLHQKIIKNAFILVLGIVLGIFFYKYFEIEVFEFTLSNVLIFAIITIGILVISFLIISGYKNNKDSEHALGLPAGSIRATLALTLVVLFVLTSLYFFLELENKKEFSENIITILGTLVIAISSFYFGIKATEQGSRIAQKVFDSKGFVSDGMNDVPLLIIQEAISNNKENWIKKYNCSDIRIGKKIVENNAFELNCIVFFVKSKKIQIDVTTEIPFSISFNSKGRQFSIPTDVRETNVDKINNIYFDELAEEKQYSIVDEYISLNLEQLFSNFPFITGVYAGRKKIKGEEIEIVSLILQVENKSDFDTPIPEHIIFRNYKIPTDIEMASKTKPNLSNSILNNGVSRINDAEYGTLGFPVNYNGDLHVLSCYHVFFNMELKSGTREIKNGNVIKNKEVISPPLSETGNNMNEIGEVVSGEISNFLDIAVMRPNPEFLEQLKKEKMPSRYRTLARKHQNKIYLRFWGNGSKRIVESKLKNISVVQPITYEGLGEVSLRGLIQLEKCSLGGDSGAAVYDLSDNLVGIILGSDSLYTYVISAYNIFDKSDYKL